MYTEYLQLTPPTLSSVETNALLLKIDHGSIHPYVDSGHKILIVSRFKGGLPFSKISRTFIDNFLIYSVHRRAVRQTDRQTDSQTPGITRTVQYNDMM